MTTSTDWRIAGESFGSCNCDWSCPCQFNARPTHDQCDALQVWDVHAGHFGDVDLSGVHYAKAFWWPGAVHEGGGTQLLMLDEGTSESQRDALVALTSGAHGHPAFEIFAAVAPNVREPVTAAIRLELDRGARRARVSVKGLASSTVEPIRNPVTHAEHRVRIDLPDGFEFKTAEIANSVSWQVTAAEPLSLRRQDTWAHLYTFDWRSDGSTR